MTFDSKALFFIATTADEISSGGQKYTKGLPSPCMSVCQMDEVLGLCQGCLRTLDEIRVWGNADAAFKRQVWLNIEARIAQHLVSDDQTFAPST